MRAHSRETSQGRGNPAPAREKPEVRIDAPDVTSAPDSQRAEILIYTNKEEKHMQTGQVESDSNRNGFNKNTLRKKYVVRFYIVVSPLKSNSPRKRLYFQVRSIITNLMIE